MSDLDNVVHPNKGRHDLFEPGRWFEEGTRRDVPPVAEHRFDSITEVLQPFVVSAPVFESVQQ